MDKLEQLKLLTEETGPEPSAAACGDIAAALSPRITTDAELMQTLELYGGDVRRAAYHVLLRKARSTKATLADMTLPEQQGYWLRRAASVRPNQTHAAERADQP